MMDYTTKIQRFLLCTLAILFILLIVLLIISTTMDDGAEIVLDDETPIITESVTEEPIVIDTEEPTNTEEPVVTVDPEYEANLSLLAHVIYAEAGSDWCSDKMQMYVGSVVLNRMNYWWYPDTMYEVVYQEGQYGCVINGHINKEPNQRAWDMAAWLLENGSQLPSTVVFQAEFEQGSGVYEKVQNMYFCYAN